MFNLELIQLDFRAKIPLYLQLSEQLRQQIEQGWLQADEQLPPVRLLAERLRVNFNTVARAYRILDIEGWISTQQGRGTFITTQSWPRPAACDEQSFNTASLEQPAPEPGPAEPQSSQELLEQPACPQPPDVIHNRDRYTVIAHLLGLCAAEGITLDDIRAYLQIEQQDKTACQRPERSTPTHTPRKESRLRRLKQSRTAKRSITQPIRIIKRNPVT